MTQDLTTLICLFHHADQAHAALQEILRSGVPEANVTLIGEEGSTIAASRSSLEELNVPARDVARLLEGLQDGGTVLSVSALSDHADNVESIFASHKASKFDEAVVEDDRSAAALPLAAAAATSLASTEDTANADATGRSIPIVEENLEVGKRDVERGGVRVYRRIVELPVDQSVTLREEHVRVERHPVDRPVTDADLALQGDRVIELTETAEIPVVSKSAHVIEEVIVGKEASQHVEHIHDTVRHTEVEVEEIAPVPTGSQTF